jgi:hypothetical protein
MTRGEKRQLLRELVRSVLVPEMSEQQRAQYESVEEQILSVIFSEKRESPFPDSLVMLGTNLKNAMRNAGVFYSRLSDDLDDDMEYIVSFSLLGTLRAQYAQNIGAAS